MDINLSDVKILSPRRNTTRAASIAALAREQLQHFSIDADSEHGRLLLETAELLYQAQGNLNQLWTQSAETLRRLDRSDKVAYFNAKRFMSFQLAKLLDTLQNPLRASFQSLQGEDFNSTTRGGYPLFDNIPAIFSATPVIARTATYIYACTEWVDDAFRGREPSHDIYSRLLNPTSISLANAIVDLECGPAANEYMAWNFNSGMAAIDALLSNQLSRGDILIVSRHIYGGVYQLLHDFYARDDKLAINLVWFDGTTGDAFEQALAQTQETFSEAVRNGARIHVYIESPCNPHGTMLDVPAICRIAHRENILVSLDSTLATPFLYQPLSRKNRAERPDFVVHSYTKDIGGSGAATAGVVIGENHRMFIPKGESAKGLNWDQSMFWNVYYIKGAFLDADKAWEVQSGMRTLEMRMLTKCINTLCLSHFFASHPKIRVNSHALEQHPNSGLRQALMRHQLPTPLFSIDMEAAQLPTDAFKRFFDALEPAYGQMVSLGQTNTMVLCPALTSHSELSPEAMEAADIHPTTIRISVGDENVAQLAAHVVSCARLHLDPVCPGFSEEFMGPEEADALFAGFYLESHKKVAAAFPKVSDYL
ncbi:aminotransferase class I/II-fold pyridoxal phosphate-dependent enzyme [Microbulbifer thermotolerans]|uniref:Aminotransferase class I/II-fold pyridoxal phosphate-dependent enzyme n=1 Tax=Microbulbifer thermotolerans TaxID=252514 RepID=A0AB35HUL3_MICTH|nr:aminotransferase class I/II-fold pyridoxal phosphate-dependent enzyme [Microbulbifer thermotolerans]MCX2780847.1 aminotransferase class I/II-fold pyridoxal phosphate-dependent enzyme [Microbulbifer thermotolerans]MCX2784154.1 aminotransferase class I/II-fold pyridoxal phosphate-dependent enzyme [Microbulbifer thermotolerans]MCX2801024.1 aminotransferase class I/II-fold pyridoxal phosphate-dependent enzyme [Microbulbifer thermotolerans]MCX2804812.1 aminotransferase class I/II-fold pyridoxal p